MRRLEKYVTLFLERAQTHHVIDETLLCRAALATVLCTRSKRVQLTNTARRARHIGSFIKSTRWLVTTTGHEEEAFGTGQHVPPNVWTPWTQKQTHVVIRVYVRIRKTIRHCLRRGQTRVKTNRIFAEGVQTLGVHHHVLRA